MTNEDPTYKNCINNNGMITSCEGQDILSRRDILSSAIVTSCIFTSLTTTDNGAAISFTQGDTLSVDLCTFSDCTAPHASGWYNGGGAVYSTAGSLLSLTSSTFVRCSTTSFGGGLLATKDLLNVSISFCSFFHCTADPGGAVSLFYGPSSTFISSRFISCASYLAGGGIYYDCTSNSALFCLSDSLFAHNTAESNGNPLRGGGAFEDYRYYLYTSKYSFSFFTENTAPNGKGNDISIYNNELHTENIQHCFTTTTSHSLCNTKYDGYDNWLPMTRNKVKSFIPIAGVLYICTYIKRDMILMLINCNIFIA